MWLPAGNLLQSCGYSIWQQLFSIDLRKAFLAMTHFGQTKLVCLAFAFLLLLVLNHVTTWLDCTLGWLC